MKTDSLEKTLNKEHQWANIPMLPSLQDKDALGKLGILVQNIDTQWSVFQMLSIASIKSYRENRKPVFVADGGACNDLFLRMLDLYIANVLHRPVKYEGDKEMVWIDTFNDDATQATLPAAIQGLNVGLQTMYRALDMSVGDLLDMMTYLRPAVYSHITGTMPLVYIEPTLSYVSLMLAGRLMSWYAGARNPMDLAAFFECELTDDGSKAIIQQYREAVTEYNKTKKQDKK